MEVTEKENTAATAAAAATTAAATTAATTDTTTVPPEEEQASGTGENRPLLVDLPIDNETTALNVLVGFLNVAQRRGTFNFRESAKIGQCIEMFVKGPGN